MSPADATLLIVDDDAGQRSLLETFLKKEGFRVRTASSAEEAIMALDAARPAMLISDVRMPGISGLDLLAHVQRDHPGLQVLLVTAFADIRSAVGAIRHGAVDYLEKPIDLDVLLEHVQRITGVRARQESGALSVPPPEGVVAESEGMREVLREAALVAPSETRVLITGETGVGKEVVADLIHAWSPRAKEPMLKINCAALPETLLESELFGHEKGAFTGALSARKGLFEEADSGTLLLDEVGEMSPALQAKLLRVMQDGCFNRVGSNAVLRTHTRILAATHRNLEEEVAAGRFREDLFYRLNVIDIHIPPLRERVADIAALAGIFATQFAKGKTRISPVALEQLERYDWPGNVRELRNTLERAVLLARGDVILPEHLPKRVQKAREQAPHPEEQVSRGARIEDIERAAILDALRRHDYNRTETAKALGISRRALTYKLRSFREQGFPVDPGL